MSSVPPTACVVIDMTQRIVSHSELPHYNFEHMVFVPLSMTLHQVSPFAVCDTAGIDLVYNRVLEGGKETLTVIQQTGLEVLFLHKASLLPFISCPC